MKLNRYIEPDKKLWQQIIARPAIQLQTINELVQPILTDVKENGDEAVKKYTKLFDKADIQNLRVSEAEINEAITNVPDALKDAIALAAANISRFHEVQIEKVNVIETSLGVSCWRKSVPINNVGLYIPGGSAPLFSTLLMLAIPAKLAGCPNIILCTPSDINGKINDAILYTANLLGLDKIFKIGGAQAIASMAYGTASVPAVNKIFGPGNQYVTAAKQLVSYEGIAIDMPAGPSELAVYADETAVPAFVAADLLSQAEHGADSQVLLVTTNEKIAITVEEEIFLQLEKLPRADITKKSLENCRVIVLEDIDTAFELLNEYAPEHLIIASENAVNITDKVRNAGSVFLGNYSPESAGDYASGTNHVLPTNGFAKTYSGVSIDSFVKKISFQELTPKGIKQIGKAIEMMAEAEGLEAHKNAVSMRLKNMKNEI